MTFWLILLTIIVIVEGALIRDCMERLDAFESWYPFCELMKMNLHKGDEDNE